MDSLRAAAPIARLLFALSERRGVHTVRVCSGARVAVLRIEDGALRELDGVDVEPLGDTLLRRGQLDATRHSAALAHGGPQQGRVGRWLVDLGVADDAAVMVALREQLRDRIARLLGWVDPQVTSSPAPVRTSELSVPLAAALWDALLARAATLSPTALTELAGERSLALSRLGERLVHALHAAGTTLPAEAVLAAHPPRSLRSARAVFRVLGAVSEPNAFLESYSLLLRKRGQIQRKAGAAALLDLREPVRPEQASRAFRRLAYRLHPDRFQCEQPELRALSSEVMSVLAAAHAQLRGVRRAG
jgi:hypothetical protein